MQTMHQLKLKKTKFKTKSDN